MSLGTKEPKAAKYLAAHMGVFALELEHDMSVSVERAEVVKQRFQEKLETYRKSYKQLDIIRLYQDLTLPLPSRFSSHKHMFKHRAGEFRIFGALYELAERYGSDCAYTTEIDLELRNKNLTDFERDKVKHRMGHGIIKRFLTPNFDGVDMIKFPIVQQWVLDRNNGKPMKNPEGLLRLFAGERSVFVKYMAANYEAAVDNDARVLCDIAPVAREMAGKYAIDERLPEFVFSDVFGSGHIRPLSGRDDLKPHNQNSEIPEAKATNEQTQSSPIETVEPECAITNGTMLKNEDDLPNFVNSAPPPANPSSNSVTLPQGNSQPQNGSCGIKELGKSLESKRQKERSWDNKSCRQAASSFGLFDKFLTEECKISSVSQIGQKHLAQFVNFLQFEIYTHYGKSASDHDKSIAVLRKIAQGKDKSQRGIQAATLNRHLTFLNQLIKYIPSQGSKFSEPLLTGELRARNTTHTRPRDQRAKATPDLMRQVFQTPPFTGCESWQKPSNAGKVVYHRALYFAVLLLNYSGARREEICGLHVDDLIQESGKQPYLSLDFSDIRRLKNPQSVRIMPIHSELIRLGFLEYCNRIKELGYERIFPDLHSGTSQSPAGDRLYDEFAPLLKGLDRGKKNLVIHSLRHGFASSLKHNLVDKEVRADLLGHGGESETDERYSEAYAWKKLCNL